MGPAAAPVWGNRVLLKSRVRVDLSRTPTTIRVNCGRVGTGSVRLPHRPPRARPAVGYALAAAAWGKQGERQASQRAPGQACSPYSLLQTISSDRLMSLLIDRRDLFSSLQSLGGGGGVQLALLRAHPAKPLPVVFLVPVHWSCNKPCQGVTRRPIKPTYWYFRATWLVAAMACQRLEGDSAIPCLPLWWILNSTLLEIEITWLYHLRSLGLEILVIDIELWPWNLNHQSKELESKPLFQAWTVFKWAGHLEAIIVQPNI